ncbi:hypothetical protein FGRMN_3486 [Fusarium graminum]|nr:hypothetical protein FGRMN_3486 [Fusarium graminum]
MSTFHQFPDLPRELRDMIWNFVIRDDRPGVHIFGQYDPNKKNMPESRPLFSAHVKSKTYSAPSWRNYFPAPDLNVSDMDVSTYLIDGGLWTACKESRLVIDKHFDQSSWPDYFENLRRTHALRGTNDVFRMPATGQFARGSLHCLTVFPNRDLFVLQLDSIEDLDWAAIGYDLPLGGCTLGWNGSRHLAIEYQQEWVEPSPHSNRHFINLFINAIFELEDKVERLWFIDHSLKRKADAPTFEEITNYSSGMNAFYATDRKFLAIDCHSSMYGGQMEGWQRIAPTSSDSFVWELNHEIDCRVWEGEASDSMGYPCDIGLLGWADL